MDEAKRDKRPCAVIGPDRVAQVRAQADISPRRTFQENMSRVVLPSPSASAASASAAASSCAFDPYANYSPYTYSPYPYYPSRPAPSPYYRPDVRYCEGPALVSQQHSYPRATPQYEDRRYHPAYAPAPNPEAYYPKPTYYEAPQPQHAQPVYPRCDYVHPCVDQYRTVPQAYPERQYYQLQYARPSPPVRQVAPAPPPPPAPRAYPAKVAYNPYYAEPQLNPTPPQNNYPYVSCEYAEAARRRAEYHRSRPVELDPSREWEANRRRYQNYPTPPTVERRAPAPCVYYQESVIRRPTVDYVRPGAPPPEPKPKIDEPPTLNIKQYFEMWADCEDFDEPKVENICIPEPSVYHPIQPEPYQQIRSKEPINIQNIQILEAPKVKTFSKNNHYFVDELIDVEAKISQSVIHKEVGCNFEIKPCSPMRVVESESVRNITKPETIPKVSNQTKSSYGNRNIMTYSEAISQQERKISKRSRYDKHYDINPKNSNIDVKRHSYKEKINNESFDSSNAQLNMKFPNMTVSSDENVNYIINAENDHSVNSVNFEVIDKSGLQMSEYYNEPAEGTVLNYSFNSSPKIEPDFITDACNKTDNFTFDLPNLKDPIIAVKLPDMEEIIGDNERETFVMEDPFNSVVDMRKEKIDNDNNITQSNLPTDFNKSNEDDSKLIHLNDDNDLLGKGHSEYIDCLEDVRIPNELPILSDDGDIEREPVFCPTVFENSLKESITGDHNETVIKLNEAYLSEQKELVENGEELAGNEETAVIELSMQIFDDENGEIQGVEIYNIEDIPEKIESPNPKIQSPNCNKSEEEEIVCSTEEDVLEKSKFPSPIISDKSVHEENTCEVENISENCIIGSPSSVEIKSGEDDINIFMDIEIETAAVLSEEGTSKSELLESADSCSELSSPKPYKSDDTEEVPNFDDENFKSLSLKLISDDDNDKYDTYSESVNKKYSSYLSDDSSSDNNYKNYKSVMLCGEKSLDTSTGEESMSPYYKDKMEQSTNLDLNGLEVGGCWIDDIACVETVVSEENEVLEAQNSPVLWNNFTTDYDRSSFLDHNSRDDDELFKDTNGNVIDQYKYKYSVDSEDNQLLSPWESDEGDDKYTLKLSVVSEESSNKKSEKEDDKPYWKTPPKLKSYSRKRPTDDNSQKSSKKMCIESKEPKKVEAPVQIKTKGAQKYIPPINISNQNLKCHLPLPKDKLLQLKKSKKNTESCSSSDDRISKNRMVLPKKPNKPLFEDVLKKIDETNRSIIKMNLKKTKKRLIPKMIIKKDEKGSHYASVPRHRDSKNRDGGGWQPKVHLRRSACIEDMVKSS